LWLIFVSFCATLTLLQPKPTEEKMYGNCTGY
jgi:hypothetical protein